MKRVPTFVWILLPAVLGGLYALSWGWFQTDVPIAKLPPADAVITMRFRNVEALDRFAPGHTLASEGTRIQRLARNANVPALNGVDRERPVHAITMPFLGVGNRTVLVFGAKDAAAFEAAFNDPGLFDQGYVRHAQHMASPAGWVAVGGQRDAVRQIGTGGIQAEERGEDFALAVDVPRLVDEVLRLPVFPLWSDDPTQSPWPAMLEVLGVTGPELVATDGLPAAERLERPAFRRVGRVRSGWRDLRIWVHAAERRAEIEATAVAPQLRAALAGATQGAAAWPPGARRLEGRRVELAVRNTESLRALLWILHHLGVRSPQADTASDGLAPLIANLPTSGPGAVLIGTRVPQPYGITWTVVASGEVHDAVAGLALPGWPALAETLPLAAGAAPLTVLQSRQPSLAGHIGRAAVDVADLPDDTGRWQALSLGATAREALARLPGQLAAPAAAPTSPAGRTVLAWFHLQGRSAQRLLGEALEVGGLLAALDLSDGAHLEGQIETDGERVYIEVRARADG